jgi:hypothetical protein
MHLARKGAYKIAYEILVLWRILKRILEIQNIATAPNDRTSSSLWGLAPGASFVYFT